MRTRTPMKAMRAKCLDCSCYQPKEVRLCTVKTCPLWPFRRGSDPGKRRPRSWSQLMGKAEAIMDKKEMSIQVILFRYINRLCLV
jgi:hypothetical protein